MTREEFMQGAEYELNDELRKVRHCIMKLIAQAYAEGQKSAGSDWLLAAVMRDALSRLEKPETASAEPETCTSWQKIVVGHKLDEEICEYRCLGVPETPLCNCGGDKSKCDFYGG